MASDDEKVASDDGGDMGLLPLGVTFGCGPRNVGAQPPSAVPGNVGAQPPSAVPRNVGAQPPSAVPRAVWGFPLHAELIVGVHGDEAAIGVSHAGVLEAGGLGITLRDGDGRVVHEVAAPEADPEHMSFFPVMSGAPRRLFVDASPLLPSVLSEEEIQRVETAEVWLATMAGPAMSARIPLEFRAPDDAEAHLWRRACAGTFGTSWGRWTLSRPAGKTPLAEAMSPGHPLVYNGVLQHLFFADLRDIDAQVLDVLIGAYADEASLWRAELLWLRGDKAGFDATAAGLLAKSPLLGPALMAVSHGNGFLTTWRGLVGRVIGAARDAP